MTSLPRSGTTCACAALACAALAAGCAADDGVRVQLDAQTPAGLPAYSVEVQAQVSGPVDSLRYHWFAGAGENDPQHSSQPTTVFTFANGTTRERVSVDVWRGDRRVAHDEIEVRLDSARTLVVPAPTDLRIAVTQVPPYDPAGGTHTRADIRGRVEGAVPAGARVVVFARADVWYIQPHPNMQHPIAADGTFATWTHTGSSYAVLVVQPGFHALPRYDLLPGVGGPVLARLLVEGAR